MEMQSSHEKNSNARDTLLRIIEDADAEAILLEENMDAFNELMKYELISILDGQIHLTERGKQAKNEGVQTVIERLRSEPQTPHIPRPAFIDRKLYYIVFLLLLLIIVAVTIGLKA